MIVGDRVYWLNCIIQTGIIKIIEDDIFTIECDDETIITLKDWLIFDSQAALIEYLQDTCQ